MMLCNLSHKMSHATTYFIISVHSSLLIEPRPTTSLIAVASASLITSCSSSMLLHIDHGVKGVREVGMEWYMQI
ncbi:BgTH12-05999 [Blumeria graminis f. sp. triticale]|uniref:BgTH12-05999 n=1 Tax=Blumeria graminis f. sp. triticale TaxID=1689686 RepID=A0A9W4DQ23_BLUGR|nr:BgTH12-05999 [Blumeria graminis f. sp. triticale]